MENYQGDLADILRATTNNTNKPSPPPQQQQPEMATPTAVADLELFPLFKNLVKFQSSETLTEEVAATDDDFGDPFSHMQDPVVGSTCFLNSDDEMMMMMLMRPSPSSSCDMFSRVLQISPTTSTKAVMRDLPGQAKSLINVNNNNNNGNTSGLQICSPRNPAIKRRKSQAKKVVCIPAATPVNSRPSGEIVPCDLWAWRKYGQKPIKGSPYPRGYYRCSSSKGCSARKQVERSRTDPNMLVITYTSEHNHPWPTQRNALAGSTRAQPSKTITLNIPTDLNQQLHDTTTSNAHVKDELREAFSPTYKPTMPDSNLNSSDEFFAELQQIETDPIRVLLNQDHEENAQIKGLDPFTIFDWSRHTRMNL